MHAPDVFIRLRNLGHRTWRYGWSILRRGATRGWCPLCDNATLFVRTKASPREGLPCFRCQGITRWRALVLVLEAVVPDWRDLKVYESSGAGGASAKFARECPGYVASQFFPGVEPGTTHEGWRVEDLTRLTFADGTFDVVITQDVFEHVPDPEACFGEVARVLRAGGVHVFTVPFYEDRLSSPRARVLADGTVEHMETPIYHDDPVSDDGALVITDWGTDLPELIERWSGMATTASAPCSPAAALDGSQVIYISRKP